MWNQRQIQQQLHQQQLHQQQLHQQQLQQQQLHQQQLHQQQTILNGEKNKNIKKITSIRLTEDKKYKKEKITKQDKISNNLEQIKKKLDGYEEIPDESLILIPTGIWIKYISDENKYRHGGMLIKNSYPQYFVLKNPTLNKTWCVDLKKNTIYVNSSVIEKEDDVTESDSESDTESNSEIYDDSTLDETITYDYSDNVNVTKSKKQIKNKIEDLESVLSDYDTNEQREKDILYELYKKGLLEIN